MARCIVASAVYPQFFGFDKLPFKIGPDAQFVYAGADYAQGRTDLLAGLRGRARILLLLGAAGMGKTLLLEDALKTLGPEYEQIRINQPQLSAQELVEAVLLQTRTPAAAAADDRQPSPADLASGIDALRSRAGLPLIVVDDAHLLPILAAKALTVVLARVPSLKVVLAGRPGFDLEQIAAQLLTGIEPRLIRLGPLSRPESRAYVDHRLSVAGNQHQELLTPDAQTAVFEQTGGAPRLINVLCDAALHAACQRASGQIGAAEVMAATQEARWSEAVGRDRAAVTSACGPTAQTPLDTLPPDEAVPGKLVVSVGRKTLSSWVLRPGTVTIGRASDNEIQLETMFVSRHHCQVTTTGPVSVIEDLESVNGIIVNGAPVKRHVLRDEDRIELGDHTLTYRRPD